MSAVNPFTPPRAEVADVHSAATEFSTPKVWSASGRIGRVRYIAYLMVGYLVFLVGGGILAAIVGAVSSASVGIAAFYLALIPYLVFSFMCGIQRAHDMGWSGWSVLLLLIPLVAFVWMLNPGSKGANRFGAPPPPNTTGVVVGAWLSLGIPVVVGILAAIALPAYQNYVTRAKAAQMQQQQQAPQQPQQ